MRRIWRYANRTTVVRMTGRGVPNPDLIYPGSEGQLRNLAMGRDNWRYFLNRTRLDWYTTFRSLIASCHLHGINPQLYIEEVLRLAPHWPATQMLQLSPKYWQQTRAAQPRAARDHSLTTGQDPCLSDPLR